MTLRLSPVSPLLLVIVLAGGAGHAQQVASAPSAAASPISGGPPDKPLVVVTENQQRLRVVPLATGLSHPWGLAFLPDGRSMLVTERPGRLRIIRDGVLDPTPIPGVPKVNPTFIGGLNDVALHPEFAKNQYVYLSYAKDGARGVTLALARGRFTGTELVEVRDIFVADAWEMSGPSAAEGGGTFGGRMLFARDGLLYMTVGDRDTRVLGDDATVRSRAQSLNEHMGKVLRLRDDGTIPKDNPFVGRAGARPEIYTYGHRNVFGLAWHPVTGELWGCEIGPMGGDELNVLLPGQNYGWPLVSLGKIYNGHLASEQSWFRPGMEMPVMFWMPAISPSSLMYYTGDKFPAWKG